MVRIILVDDEKQALREMREELQEHGWEVAAFSDPGEALSALQTSSYDLGVFDIRMPGMSGVELLEKSKAWQNDMDSILITAQPDLSTAIDAIQLGVLDYVKRPFRLRELVQVINRVLTHRFLRLNNLELSKKLETLGRLAGSLTPVQALKEIFHETMSFVIAAISPRYTYIAFIEEEHIGSVFEMHGLTNDQKQVVIEQRDAVQRWMADVMHSSWRVFDVFEDSRFPFHIEGMNAILWAPITHDHKLIGGFLCGALSREAFSVDDERFLALVGHLISHGLTRIITVSQHYQESSEYLRAVVKEVAPNLKNPLTLIGGVARQAMDTLDSNNPLFQDLQFIYEQAIRADEQLEELLGFCYRTDILELKRHNLIALVEEAVDAWRNREELDGIELVVVLDSHDIPVACDSLQLKRAISNVIQNAVQDAQEYDDGKVTIKVSVENGSALIRVHNMGEPSPQEHWDELFNTDLTSPSTVTEAYQRSEHGLPVARGILRSHGGEVQVETSQAGQGTTLLITLPLDVMR